MNRPGPGRRQLDVAARAAGSSLTGWPRGCETRPAALRASRPDMNAPQRLEHPNLLLQSFINGHLVTQVMAEVTGRHGLTPDEFGVQSVIMFREPITPTELAGLIGSPPTTLSAHIRRLGGRGQITRRRNPDDGRSYLLEVTPAGRRTVEAIIPAFAELLARIEGQLDSGDETRVAMQRFEAALRGILADATPAKR